MATAVASVACGGVAVAAQAQSGQAPAGSVAAGEQYDQYIVAFEARSEAGKSRSARAEALRAVGARHGVAVSEVRELAVGGFVVRTDRALGGERARGFLRSLAARADVEYAEPDVRFFPTATRNDTNYNQQWHYWEETAGCACRRRGTPRTAPG
ncbi:hypothetical protein ACFQV2_18085 [Actinokineospora soli]|uniref:Peptidase inhibitor I9 n=1 Tax=Actinokineospora soli TaxID=1048753 RepID=A0ABW2TPP1_9PSEU